MIRFAKWRARESFVLVSVSGVKGGLDLFSSGCTFNILTFISFVLSLFNMVSWDG